VIPALMIREAFVGTTVVIMFFGLIPVIVVRLIAARTIVDKYSF